MQQESLIMEDASNINDEAVECLGLTFENDEARRAHFTKLLAEKLKDPEFRKIEGFPIGTDEAILELSDPPYYTACPNPWLKEFISLWESQNEKTDEDYHREPFAADVTEGKNDRIYNAHSYHTKVPHKAVMRYILHYTDPGDIVFDGFCGTGMTGVAAKMCGDKSEVESLGYKVLPTGDILTLKENSDNEWVHFSKLGERKTILNDLSPIATFISKNYNHSTNSQHDFFQKASSVVKKLKKQFNWMYETSHTNGDVGLINYVIWSEVLLCPECTGEMVFWDVAVNKSEGKVLNEFNCPSCNSSLTKRKLNKCLITEFDSLLNENIKVQKLKPVQINYKYGKQNFEKRPDKNDIETIEKVRKLPITGKVPTDRLIFGQETRRNDKIGMTHVHHFYTERTLQVFSNFLSQSERDLYWVLTGSLQRGSKQHQVAITRIGGPKAGEGGATAGHRRGTLYVPSNQIEMNALNLLSDRVNAISKAVSIKKPVHTAIGTGSTSSLSGIPDNSVDYLFFDPPFGANIAYSELNFIQESWLGVVTNQKLETIEDKAQKKSLTEYKHLIQSSFDNAYRVLKPGRWLTVEFSNTSAAVWNVIQVALQASGFIVASVAALDKKRGGLNSIVGPTAVKQDLAISLYKPLVEVKHDILSKKGEESVWCFVRNHLENLQVVKFINNDLGHIQERDPRILYDRLIGYYLSNGKDVPINSKEFQTGLRAKFVERDGMFFLPSQAAEYDKRRATNNRIEQLTIFVDDEASAIDWIRQELKSKPKTYADIHPSFINELSGWKKNELQLELSTLLEQNFIKYDGKEDVPNQIHTYLSTNFKDMRGLAKNDPALVAKAKDRWYVPDPNKAGDLEKVRLRALLREFEVYKAEKKKIKQPRAEALRAGFNHCWENQDLQTILDISAKIPPAVLQEDEKLLMFYDNAVTLTSNTDDDWDL
ncbi:DNA methylase [Alteromonas marina]|uniref:DNA methylase n=1 Tax=Alteromonas marina TaxID=203795 RepID=A0A0B3YWG9_9ALTE|nr:DNA methyltransferase [Alteromonas marina]KHT46326.1 DNA methylase [Alteromonas marina]